MYRTKAVIPYLLRSSSSPRLFQKTNLQQTVSSGNGNGQVRGYLWRPWWWDNASSSSDLMNRVDRQFRDLEREFDRFWTTPPASFFGPRAAPYFFDLTPLRAAADLERFHLQRPIVEEEGKKKFKLVFDVSHFNPDEIEVKTTGGRLSISAKHQSKDKEKGHEQKYEYYREYSLPEGVKAEEVTCKYAQGGQLIAEAPYTPPVISEEQAKEDQSITVKHE